MILADKRCFGHNLRCVISVRYIRASQAQSMTDYRVIASFNARIPSSQAARQCRRVTDTWTDTLRQTIRLSVITDQVCGVQYSSPMHNRMQDHLTAKKCDRHPKACRLSVLVSVVCYTSDFSTILKMRACRSVRERLTDRQTDRQTP